MANFVSNDNATSLMNAINSKKDTKPVEITYAEWIVLTDEERAGTHYLITDVPAQSGGGHVIENTSGTDMPQEDNLQFVGVYSEDDSTNNRTKVNIVRDMTKAQMDALSSAEKEGFIHVTDEPDNPYNGESGGGGHTICGYNDEMVISFPNRSNLQIRGASVSDNQASDSTIIDIKDISGNVSINGGNLLIENYQQATNLDVGSTDGSVGRVNLSDSANSGYKGTIVTRWGWYPNIEGGLTADRHYILPDKSGTLAIKEKENLVYTAQTNFTSLATGRNYFYKRNADVHLHCNIYKTSGGGFTQGTWYDVIELQESARPAELIYGYCVFTIEGGAAESSKKGVAGIMKISSSGIVSVMPLDDKYSSINNVSIDIVYPEAF